VAEERLYPRNLRSDELICLPFLDTDTTKELPEADATPIRPRSCPKPMPNSGRGVIPDGSFASFVE
jgi:hypothetical protein